MSKIETLLNMLNDPQFNTMRICLRVDPNFLWRGANPSGDLDIADNDDTGAGDAELGRNLRRG
jgi:hypothetical protein